MCDNRYKLLFEPVRIGPVTAKNRFYQVPHCCGMGHRYQDSARAVREMKAQGGWAVVCTEECEIHPSSDLAPYLEGRLWNDSHIDAFVAKTGAIHAHGALAGIELVHNGLHAANLYSREVPIGPSDSPVHGIHPVSARAMDKADIKALRGWYKAAARRAVQAGFDIIYVYAGHDMSILHHFLSRRHNRRCDEYGGSLENRLRLFRQVLADTREAAGGKCAIAVRLAVDELLGAEGIEAEGEGHDIIASLAEEPDLWDVNISGWDNDSQTARFSQSGFQEEYIGFVKKLTSKPVVGVGRYTSPDDMVRVIRSGIMDMIGAARPSIADPFLPKKIEQGRIDDIRECIGCNICVMSDNTCTPIRCTQNPAMGEEWRKGWHPEYIAPVAKREKVLVVGGGPAGLEAARALSQRGCDVLLAEKSRHWGGRVYREAQLPGLSAWQRVSDWRLGQLEKMDNASLYLASEMTAHEIAMTEADHVVLATGSTWRRDGIGRSRHKPIEGIGKGPLLVPEDLMDGRMPDNRGPVVIYDDDGIYMGGLLAQKCALAGLETVIVTPYAVVSPWCEYTLELERIQRTLLELGVTIITNAKAGARHEGALETLCVFTGRVWPISCHTLVPVTARLPDRQLYDSLMKDRPDAARTIVRIGDCLSPGAIVHAVYDGHRHARQFGSEGDSGPVAFRLE